MMSNEFQTVEKFHDVFVYKFYIAHWHLVDLHAVAQQGRINHMAEAAYAAGPALFAILGGPALFPKKVVQ